MSRHARSARGEIIDFDLLAIKQQLATTPVPVSVDQRRRFIDEKDGIKTREVLQQNQTSGLPDALSMAATGAQESAQAAKRVKQSS